MDNKFFAPPKAAVADTEKHSLSRPALVWVIVIYRCLSLLGRLALAALAAAGAFDSHPLLVERYAAGVSSRWLLLTSTSALGLAASVQLFRLRKSAPFLMSATFCMGIYSTLTALQRHPPALAESIGYVAGTAIGLTMLGYTWSLYWHGRLR